MLKNRIWWYLRKALTKLIERRFLHILEKIKAANVIIEIQEFETHKHSQKPSPAD